MGLCVLAEGGDRAMQGVGWWMALLSLDTRSGSSSHSLGGGCWPCQVQGALRAHRSVAALGSRYWKVSGLWDTHSRVLSTGSQTTCRNELAGRLWGLNCWRTLSGANTYQRWAPKDSFHQSFYNIPSDDVVFAKLGLPCLLGKGWGEWYPVWLQVWEIVSCSTQACGLFMVYLFIYFNSSVFVTTF